MHYLMLSILIDAKEMSVRTTVTIDDELFQRALEVAYPPGDEA